MYDPNILLAVVVVVVIVGEILALPIIAVLQGRRISRLRARIEQLERQSSADSAPGVPAAPAALPAVLGPTAVSESVLLSRLQARIEQLERHSMAEPAPRIPVAPAALPAMPGPTTVSEPVLAAELVAEPPALPLPRSGVGGEMPGEDLEAWVGRRLLGWVAMVLLLFATAFFLKQVFDNRWIGETGRVMLGVTAGLALCLAGRRYHRLGWRRFSQMLTAGGVVLLYLSTFAAFGYYHLLPRQHAAIFLITLIVETAALAVLYEAPAIAIMAVIGGLLTPVLLHSEHDQYRSLFLYLTAINVGVVGLAWFRPWPVVGTLALLGSHGLFWVWYGENYHPAKLGWALAFQGALFSLALLYSMIMHLFRPRKAGVEDLVRMLLAAGLFFAAVHLLLNDDYHVWMGSLAIVMAILYTLLARISLRLRPDDPRQTLAAATVAMGFVATAIPLQADAAWIGLGWAVQGLVLWWFGCRVRTAPMRVLGGLLLAMAGLRLLVFDTPQAHAAPFLPIFNSYALPALTIAACLLGLAAIAARSRARLKPFDELAGQLAGLAGLALVWLIVSVETYDYFQVQIAQQEQLFQRHPVADPAAGRAWRELSDQRYIHLQRAAQTALSVVWAVYGAAVLAAGFGLRSRQVRSAALIVFAVTLGKVVLVDMAHLPGFYRVATFLALAVLMAAAAWAYQRWHFARVADSRKGELHDSL